MENFVLENPTKIIFGRDTITEIGKETITFGDRVLLVYGQQSCKSSGLYDTIYRSLNEAGILTIIDHGGVKSNPTLHHVRQGIRLTKEHNISAILAVGGGSVIDSGKAISAGALVDHDVWKFFTGKKGIQQCLPVNTVLTIPASASEMNGGMVITDEERGFKLGVGNKKLCPKVSILDPTVTYTVPKTYTAYGAIDAIGHLLEFYCTSHSPAPIQERFMEGLLITIMESCDIALHSPCDYQARANLMWCATMALNGWTAAGLGRVGFPMHMIEHSLSALYNVPHGAGLSVIIPAWLTWESTRNPHKIGQLAQRVFNISSGSPSEKAARGIDLLRQWFTKVNSPTTLAMLEIPNEAISKIALNSLKQAKIWRLREYTQEIIEEILELGTRDNESKE